MSSKITFAVIYQTFANLYFCPINLQTVELVVKLTINSEH